MSIRRITTLCLAGVMAFAMTTLADGASSKKFDELILAYDKSNYNRDAAAQLMAGGHEASDAIFAALDKDYEHWGIYRAGTTPKPTYGPLPFWRELLALTDKITAPLPVDRLCAMLDNGRANIGDETLLNLLSSTGHPKALAYMQYCRQLAAKSAHPDMAQAVALIDTKIERWKGANEWVTRGATTLIGYSASPATQAMRSLYLQNPQAFEWKQSLSQPYLTEKFNALVSLKLDPEKKNHAGISGQWYEPILLPAVQAWFDGNPAPLETLLGGHEKAQALMGATQREQSAYMRRLIADMTSDAVLPIKLALMKQDSMNDYSSALKHHKTELWLSQYLENQMSRSNANERAIFALLADAGRPLTGQEKSVLAQLVVRPRMTFDSHNPAASPTIVKLAHQEPEIFRGALKEQHLSAPVLDAIISEKLCDDEKVIFDKIEYALSHDWQPSAGAMTPEKLAALPPDARARYEARMSGNKAPRRIYSDWFELLMKYYKDKPQTLELLEKFDKDPDYANNHKLFELYIAMIKKGGSEGTSAAPAKNSDGNGGN